MRVFPSPPSSQTSGRDSATEELCVEPPRRSDPFGAGALRHFAWWVYRRHDADDSVAALTGLPRLGPRPATSIHRDRRCAVIRNVAERSGS
jgi:hypothetical protein